MSFALHVRLGAALAALLIAITPHRADAQFDALSKKMTDKIGSVGGERASAPAAAKPAHAKSRAKPAFKAAEEQGVGELPGTQPDSGLRGDSVPARKSLVRPRRSSNASPKGKRAIAPQSRTRAAPASGRTVPARAQ
jgi:hypothetical protein